MEMTWRFLISTVLVVTSVSASDCIVDGSSWCRCDRSDTAAVDCTAWETEALFHDTNVFPVGTTIVRLSVGSMITLRNMSSFPGLKELHLPYNDIYHIQVDAFRNVEGLLKLDLSNNGLMRLRTDTFEGLTSLTYLDLSVNALIYPEDGGWVMFGRQYLPQLRMLNLSHNALVNGVYKEFDNLEVLDLSHNQIQYFEDWDTRDLFSFNPPLRVLNLSSNVLRLFSRQTVAFPNMETLMVENNRWDCSNRTLSVCTQVAWLGRETFVRDFNAQDKMLCDFPSSRRHLSVYSLSESCNAMYHDPPPKHHAASAAYIVFPIALIIILALAALYIYRRKKQEKKSEFSDVRPLEMAA